MMKKYLMTGMAAVAFCAVISSCSSKGDDLYDPDVVIQNEAAQIEAKYNDAFIQTFGTPASNQDWGFGNAKASTRTANTNSNQWFDPNYFNFEQPADITPGEIEVVTAWFASHGKNDGTTLDLNNYFVQQISYGGITYTADTRFFEKYEYQQDGTYKEVWRSGTEQIAANGHMDLVWATLNSAHTSYDHMKNFNTSAGSIIYMQDSETKYGFGYHESYGTANNDVYDNYLLAHITGTASDGTKVDGYYVGFDYQCYKQESYQYTNESGETVTGTYYSVQLDPDGVYNDRIVKIVPAKKKDEEEKTDYQYRVIAEDLNATSQTSPAAEGGLEESDWDFNDVVFDVKFVDGGAEVKVVGAGGVLPLYVGYLDEAHEVHRLLGQSGPNAEGQYQIQNSGSAKPFIVSGVTTVNAIQVWVKRPSSTGEGSVISELKAPSGKPSAKICVKPTFVPCGERVDIRKQYTRFANWVTSGQGEWY